MAKLIFIPNPLKPNEKIEKVVDIHNTEQLQQYPLSDFVIAVNGKTILTHKVVTKKDVITVIPIIRNRGTAKNVVKTLALIATAVYAPELSMSIMGATAGIVPAGLYGGATGALIYGGLQAGVVLAGGMLINSVLPTPTPSYSQSDFGKYSPTYAFSSVGNQKGGMLPIVIGDTIVKPPVIHHYIEQQADKNYLSALYALNDGKIDEVVDIFVNGQKIDNFFNTTHEIRLGLNNQEPINFVKDIDTKMYNREVMATPFTVTTTQEVERVDITFSLPKGLYYLDGNGFKEHTIELDVYYRKQGTTEWEKLQSERPLYKYWYHDGDGVLQDFDEYKGSSWYDASNNKVWYFDHKEQIGTEQVQFNITGMYQTAKMFTYTIDNLERSIYEIKISRVDEPHNDIKYAEDIDLAYINEVNYKEFTYPDTALLAVRFLATGELNGSEPSVEVRVRNNYLRYWDGNTLVETVKPLNNPANAVLYLLYKAGYTNENIDLTPFEEWEQFCNDNGFTVNLVIDSPVRLEEVINKIALLGFAKVVIKGTKWSPLIDRATEPTQAFFTSGNTRDFTLEYIPYAQRAGAVEVTYFPYVNGKIEQKSLIVGDDSLYKTSITLYGCTSEEHAKRYAKFLLNYNRYITKIIHFRAYIDSLVSNVGDVVKIGRTYILNQLADGRVVYIHGNSLTIDKEVTLDLENKNYSIEIRTEDGLRTFDITEQTAPNKIVIDKPEDVVIPDKAVYSLGETGYETGLYRILAISKNNDLYRNITAIEYHEGLYDLNTEWDGDIEEVDYGVYNLKATDSRVLQHNSYIDTLVLEWQGGKISETVVIDGVEVGKGSGRFEYYPVTRGRTYHIRVGNAYIEHTFNGYTENLPKVTNLDGYESGNNFYIHWDYPNIPIKGFKVITNTGNAEIITQKQYHFYKKNIEQGVLIVYPVGLDGSLGEGAQIILDVGIPNKPEATFKIAKDYSVLTVTVTTPFPDDFKAVNVYYAGERISKQSKTFQLPIKNDNTFEISIEDIGGNESDRQQYAFYIPIPDKPIVNQNYINGKVAFSWQKQEKPIRYKVKKGNNWTTGDIVYDGEDVIFFPNNKGEYIVKAYITNAYGLLRESEATVFSVEGDVLPKNVVKEHNEPDFTGYKERFIVDSDNVLTNVSDTYLFDDIPNFDEVLSVDKLKSATDATYITEEIDLGREMYLENIEFDVSYSVTDVEAYIDNWSDFDSVANFDGDLSGAYKFERYIQIYKNGNWSDWLPFEKSGYIGEKFKFKVHFTCASNTIFIDIYSISITLDVPDRVEQGTVTTPITVTYTTPFNEIPKTVATIVNAGEGDDLRLTNQTVNGFTLEVVNNGNSVNREVNYISKGY